MRKQTVEITFNAEHYSLVVALEQTVTDWLADRERAGESDTVIETGKFIREDAA
jgi:hypothetical protein